MSDITRLSPKPPSRPSHAPVDPAVEDFLHNVSSVTTERNQLRTALADRERTIEQLEDRVRLLSDELDFTRHDRDKFQSGFYSLQAQLSVLATNAVRACNQVIDCANAAIDGVREEMNGRPKPSPAIDDIETEIARLAATEGNGTERSGS